MLVNNADRVSHAHCVPRQDHDRLMGMMNMARGANSNLAGETGKLQAENEALHALLADACETLCEAQEGFAWRARLTTDEGVSHLSEKITECLERIKEAQ